MSTVVYATGEDYETARVWAEQQRPVVWVTCHAGQARTDAANGYRVIAVGGPALRDLRDVASVIGVMGHDAGATALRLKAFGVEGL